MKALSIKSLLRLVPMTALLAGESGAAVISRSVPVDEGLVTLQTNEERHRIHHLDLNEDGIEDFHFKATSNGVQEIFPTGINRVAATPPPPPQLGAVLDSQPPLSLIGTGAQFSISWWRNTVPEFDVGGYVPVEWVYPLRPGKLTPCPEDYYYVGLEFSAADGLHYGYLKLYRTTISSVYTELAWETQPGVAIQIPVPEPTAALLLLPCAALCLRRRRA